MEKHHSDQFPSSCWLLLFLGSKALEEEESTFSSPLMFWLQQEQKRKECLGEKKPKKGLVFEISSDDGFQICAESIEGENCVVLVVLGLACLARSKIMTSEDLLRAFL